MLLQPHIMSDFTIHKDSPVPLHIQLVNELRQKILAQELEPHSRVPSEPYLATSLNISRTTIRQAWQIAEEEGLLYRIHGKGTYVAQPVATRDVKLIGFLIPNFGSSFDSQLLSGAEKYLRKLGYRIMFAHTDRHVDEENRLLQEMWQEGVSGFLLWPALGRGEFRFLERSQNIPTVFMDRAIPGLKYPCVAAEHYRGAINALEHLIGLGHKEIAFVSRPHLDLWPIAERLRGYNDAMQAAGLNVRPPILVGENTEIGTRQAQEAYDSARGEEIKQLQAMLQQPNRPTAIFAMNDLMAIQIVRAVTVTGLKVPDDLSVVGFDDMEIVSHIDPPLTTIAQSSFDIGAEAARLLLNLIDGKVPASLVTLLPTHLVVRESTSRLNEQKGLHHPQ